MSPVTVADWDAVCPPGVIRPGVVLAPFTSFRVGGPAEWFLEARTTDDLAAAVAGARALGVPLTILGGGSNVLVADGGVPGLVIRVRTAGIVTDGESLVRADAGVTLNGLVRWLIVRGLGGLEAWAGTPGTVGGAVYGNAHYGGRLIGDRIVSVRVLGPSGETNEVSAADMAFGYDTSRLQTSREVLLSARFRVDPGQPVEVLRESARASLAHRKRTQPLQMPSAGCAFQNPVVGRDPIPAGCPASAGALIDRAGLKGTRIGGAMVSPVHANFIVNAGGASAADIRALVERCRHEVASRFGVVLRDEIVYLGSL